MDRQAETVCQHCGKPGARDYANDGALVCGSCAAYDQIVMSDLRVSQASLHVVPTGEADHLTDAARRSATWRVVAAAVVLLCSIVTMVYGSELTLAYVTGGIGAFLSIILLVDAHRLRRFSLIDAPEIERRATSSPPPAMLDARDARSA